MFWRIGAEKSVGDLKSLECSPEGRFVLHQHRDDAGEHLDLRLECDGHLQGWRIEGLSLEEESWATEKARHPVAWLDNDGDATRLDSGEYGWLERGQNGGTLLLEGHDGCREVRVTREVTLDTRDAREIVVALRDCGALGTAAAGLISDGAVARERAVQRLCGLGRELDGNAFDEAVWRKTLRGLTLDEIHAQLRGFELRFDRAYPAEATSQAEQLPEEEVNARAGMVMSILRG